MSNVLQGANPARVREFIESFGGLRGLPADPELEGR